MIKFLFFDYRDLEVIRGFQRRLEPPTKHGANPLLVSDHRAEGQHMSFYGSVVRRPGDGLWQMWYTVRPPDIGLALAYAESDDGIAWHRPELGLIRVGGEPTHLVLINNPHGAAVLYDEQETRPDWRYKLMAGASPSDRISAFCSADGIHWLRAAENPAIGTHPDCPMSLQRAFDGRYVLYARPGFGDRRVSRRESWDFVHWTEPKIVIDQDPRDDPQTQFYGLGAIPYGAYEIGTLWIYHTVAKDLGFNKMAGHQQPEFVYGRSGYAWHRAALGEAWIALGEEGSWEWGNIQPASAPVLLDDEIRFYYAAARTEHGQRAYEGTAPRYGIGLATCRPDRFVSVSAVHEGGQILTRPFWVDAPEFWVNATVADGGEIRVAVTDLSGQPIEGFAAEECLPVRGDSLRHRLAWAGESGRGTLTGQEIRLQVEARGAAIYALMAGSEAEVARYWEFDIPPFLSMAQQERQRTP